MRIMQPCPVENRLTFSIIYALFRVGILVPHQPAFLDGKKGCFKRIWLKLASKDITVAESNWVGVSPLFS